MRMLRAAVLAPLGLLGACTLATWAASLTASGMGRVEEVIAWGAAASGAVLAAWYGLTAVALLLAEIAALHRLAARPAAALRALVTCFGAPVLRRAAVVGAGIALGALPASAGGAEDGVPQDLRPGRGSVAEETPAPGVESTAGGGAPRAGTEQPTADEPAAPREAEETATEAVEAAQPADAYVVRRGDSLWCIAAAHLGAGVGDAQIAAEWPRWYATNRAVVGADPDLIHPGQVLLVPDPKDAS